MREFFTVCIAEDPPDQPDPAIVYLHLADLTAISGMDPSLLGFIVNEPALERAGKIKARKQIATRQVHRILSGYLHCAADQIMISVNGDGKPYLTDCNAGIQYNVSHTGEMLAVAVSRKFEVGVDIEQYSEEFDVLELSSNFPESVNQWLKTLPACERKQAFYKYWTTNEAIFKCIGTGIMNNFIHPEDVASKTGVVVVADAVIGYQCLDFSEDFALCVAARSSAEV